MNQPLKIISSHPLSEWFNGNLDKSAEEQIVEVVFDSIKSGEDRQQYLASSLGDIPDPNLAKNIPKAVDTFLKAIGDHQKILIIGDYDVDGITSTVLLIRFFQTIGYTNYDSFIPNRFTHGYGLTDKTVEVIFERQPDLVITVDNGITARNEIQRIQEKGIDVIVTDHHLPKENEVPDCVIINPKQDGCGYPFKELAGVGVVYIFLIALRAELRNRGFWQNKNEPNLLKHLDLVAIGTIADQVPLIGVNRIFAKRGLDQMTKRIHEGHPETFYYYLKVFSDRCRLKSFDSNSVTFRLAPMLNAAGRMKDAISGVSFMLSDSEQNAISRFNFIERLNVQRRKTQKVMVRKALKKASSLYSKDEGLVIYDGGFHEGLIGVVASRIVDQFELPCVVATDSESGLIKASCRSRKENIMDILQQCEEYLYRFGGHANAAGLSIEKDKLPAFHKRYTEVCAKLRLKDSTKQFIADIEVQSEMLTFDLLDKMRMFEPFGQENRKPVFVIRGQQLPLPSILTGKHLKWGLQRDLEIIFWNGDLEMDFGRDFDIAFTLSENYYRGDRKRQLIVEAITPSAVN